MRNGRQIYLTSFWAVANPFLKIGLKKDIDAEFDKISCIKKHILTYMIIKIEETQEKCTQLNGEDNGISIWQVLIVLLIVF